MDIGQQVEDEEEDSVLRGVYMKHLIMNNDNNKQSG